MSIHRPAGALILSLAIAFAACDDDYYRRVRVRASLNEPSAFGPPAPFAGASVFPSTIGFTAVPVFRCPSISPFSSTFSLFIDQRGGSDVFLDDIVFVFVDVSDHRSPLQLTRGDLTTMFGSTLVSAGATRTFRFSPQFGCGFISVPSLLVIDLSVLNRSGVSHRNRLTAFVR